MAILEWVQVKYRKRLTKLEQRKIDALVEARMKEYRAQLTRFVLRRPALTKDQLIYTTGVVEFAVIADKDLPADTERLKI